MSKEVNNLLVVLAFFDQEKAQLPAIRISEEPMLLTKSKINRPGINFLSIFAKKRPAVKSRTRSRPRPRPKI